jgi:hypothetical protein
MIVVLSLERSEEPASEDTQKKIAEGTVAE